jgi:hypothetical protein
MFTARQHIVRYSRCCMDRCVARCMIAKTRKIVIWKAYRILPLVNDTVILSPSAEKGVRKIVVIILNISLRFFKTKKKISAYSWNWTRDLSYLRPASFLCTTGENRGKENKTKIYCIMNRYGAKIKFYFSEYELFRLYCNKLGYYFYVYMKER